LTVPSPNFNVQRTATCGKLLSPVVRGPLHSEPQSRDRQRIPVLPSQQSNGEGAAQGQSPGRCVLTHRAGQLGMAQNPAAPARRRGARSHAESRAEGTRHSGGSCPTGCAGTGQAKECLASPPGGGERLFIPFSVDFRLSLAPFIYKKRFESLTRARLLIWVKETRLWPQDSFKVRGFMLLASLRYVCKC